MPQAAIYAIFLRYSTIILSPELNNSLCIEDFTFDKINGEYHGTATGAKKHN
jgi:hypothetical protein